MPPCSFIPKNEIGADHIYHFDPYICDVCNNPVTNDRHIITEEYITIDSWGMRCENCSNEYLSEPNPPKYEKFEKGQILTHLPDPGFEIYDAFVDPSKIEAESKRKQHEAEAGHMVDHLISEMNLMTTRSSKAHLNASMNLLLNTLTNVMQLCNTAGKIMVLLDVKAFIDAMSITIAENLAGENNKDLEKAGEDLRKNFRKFPGVQ